MRLIRPSRRLKPFDSDQFIFELKVDGFRALAHIEAGQGQLISRSGNTFRGFADLATWIAKHLRVESAVLDGEIDCGDDDTPVTPLPEGSGSLTSGVIGHAITRGDAFVGDYSWTLSPSTLNQFRVGYSRRDLNQASLQNGGINIPGLPANSFGSVLPIFTVTGFQQIGPTAASNSNFTTSITEFLDTFTIVRGRHTIKFGTDLLPAWNMR